MDFIENSDKIYACFFLRKQGSQGIKFVTQLDEHYFCQLISTYDYFTG